MASPAKLAAKIWRLRILRDEQSAEEAGAAILVVSQFTLYGDARKGRRPAWAAAAPSNVAEPIYHAFRQALRNLGAHVPEGVFRADMQLSLTNDGPTTVILDS